MYVDTINCQQIGKISQKYN